MALWRLGDALGAAQSVYNEGLSLGGELAAAVASRDPFRVYELGRATRQLVGPAITAASGVRAAVSDLLSHRRARQDTLDFLRSRSHGSHFPAEYSSAVVPYTGTAAPRVNSSSVMKRTRKRTVAKKRRTVRRSKVGLRRVAKAQVLRRRFMCESVLGSYICGLGTVAATQNGFGGAAGNAQLIHHDVRSAGSGVNSDGNLNGNATTIMLMGSLSHLYNSNQQFKSYFSQMYEKLKCHKITFKLLCPVKPAQSVTTANEGSAAPTQYIFNNVPSYDEDVSWIDDDGQLDFGSNFITPPGTGDYTNIIRGRKSAKMHRAYTNIVRTIVPKMLVPAQPYQQAAGNWGIPGNTSPAYVLTKPSTYIELNPATTNTGLIGWYGMGVAFSYKATTGTTLQPSFSYTGETHYDVSLLNALF